MARFAWSIVENSPNQVTLLAKIQIFKSRHSGQGLEDYVKVNQTFFRDAFER
jgi:hypothetical protein